MKKQAFPKRVRLRRLIKSMYILRDLISKDKIGNPTFRKTPRDKIIEDLNEIIELSLEEYYAK